MANNDLLTTSFQVHNVTRYWPVLPITPESMKPFPKAQWKLAMNEGKGGKINNSYRDA